METGSNGRSRVVAIKGEHKQLILDQVLGQAGFYESLGKRLAESGKEQEAFLVAVKPNIMMGYSRDDPSTITDPELVEYLVDAMVGRGFSNVAVVESQNVYGNWYNNREVLTVARYFGYGEQNYRLVDLTEEMVPFEYGGRLGRHPVGPTWRDADYRISFAKNKTHSSCYFTLTLKNLYGCMPMQNKFKEYHKKREFDWPAIESLKHFPCHFGLIDAFWSADGMLGFKADYSPKHTKTIIGGEDVIAVEWVGARKMGLEPEVSRIFTCAVEAFGMPDVQWEGDQSLYEDWVNMPPLVDKVMDFGEEFYSYSNIMGFLTSDMDPYFSPKTTFRLARGLRRVMKWILRQISRYGL
jgi:uncharacterized protein (DUF362 family)